MSRNLSWTMASSSSGTDTTIFQLNMLKLPKVIHVLEYVASRTSSSIPIAARLSHTQAVLEMAKEVHQIWANADCPPKSVKSIAKCFERLLLEKKRINKNKKPHENRKFEDRVFDVLTDQEFRLGLTFDSEFYEEQKTTWKSQMEKFVNPTFIEEEAEKEEKKQAKAKKKKSQFADFSVASIHDVNQVIHEVK